MRNITRDWKEIRLLRKEEAETILARMYDYISYEVCVRRLLIIQKRIDRLMGA